MPPGDENKAAEGTTGAKSEHPAQPPVQPPVQPASEPKPKTEEVNISRLTEEDPNTITVDWGSEGDAGGEKTGGFFDGKTKPVSEVKPPGGGGSASTSGSAPAVKSPSFEIGIKVAVAIIDFIMSNVLCKIAGDKSAHQYTADKASKENLQDSLMMILEENKVNLPTWLIVLFAFLAAYGFQIMAAIEARKEKSQQKKDPAVAAATVTATSKEALKPGVFEKDGKFYRRYANGAVHERKFKPDGTEITIGQPPRRGLSQAA